MDNEQKADSFRVKSASFLRGIGFKIFSIGTVRVSKEVGERRCNHILEVEFIGDRKWGDEEREYENMEAES